MPTKALSSKTGTVTATGCAPRRSWISVSTRSKSAPTRSILLTKAMAGTPYLAAWRQTTSDCASTPPTPQKTATTPSSTRRERSTSTVKSTCPGVSIRLMRWLRQEVVVAALTMVMPRSCSWSIQSMVVLPSSTSPMRWVRPV